MHSNISCTACVQYYEPSHFGSCVDICGDEVLINLNCDYRKGEPLDGCTDECEIEDGFECMNESMRSICSYTRVLDIRVVGYSRVRLENKFVLEVKIEPFLWVFKTSQVRGAFQIANQLFSLDQVEVNKETSTFSFRVDFTQDLL